jgi:quercetin dioxygenase-like cupin family protein
MCVDIMRTDTGRDPHNRGLQDLVGELSTRSETFRLLWADHNAYEELAITAEPGLTLVIYTAEPGSPSAGRLRLLASWGASEQAPAATNQHEEEDRPVHEDHPSSSDTAAGPGDWFTGNVYSDGIRTPDDQSAIGCAHVRFTPGACTAWHHHPKGQTLYVTDGIGYAAGRGGEPHEIRPGIVVYIKPGEEHWHGATPGRFMATSPSRRRTTLARP